MICEGVFERFPGLVLVMSGFGFAWLPALSWRMDQQYRHGATAVPAKLTQLPSDVLREHVRFVVGPLDLPPDPSQLVDTLSLAGGTPIVFGSGPSRTGDLSPTEVCRSLPDDVTAAYLYGTAHDLYPRLGHRKDGPT
jgi:predicted TIM-barrel fold metal-dependent hydrolase